MVMKDISIMPNNKYLEVFLYFILLNNNYLVSLHPIKKINTTTKL